MVHRDLGKYLDENYSSFVDTLENLSINKKSKTPLVNLKISAYGFDSIYESIFGEGQKNTSADAIYIGQNSIYLIEFKSGFVDKVKKDEWKSPNCPCENCNTLVEKYRILFFKNRKQEKENLKKTLSFKLLESFMVLDKCILPDCENSLKNYKLKFFIVIDRITAPLEVYDLMLQELADYKTEKKSIDQSISRYRKRDKNGQAYFYDSIEIYGAPEFCESLLQ